jgi:hypothetical protein
MRVVSLLVVLLSLSFVSAQEGKRDKQQQEQPKTPAALAESDAILEPWRANAPATLAEAHVALERMLSPETLADIDAMPSEGCMIQYHMSLGLNIRNGWGLWAGSRLAKHMQELGFTQPDGMSGVILETFWCKRHGQDLLLKERAAGEKKPVKTAQQIQEEEEKRVQKAKAAIRNMMMGLRFDKRSVPTVRVPIGNGLSVRFLCRFRNGVFLTAYRQGRISSGLFGISEGFYVDPEANDIYPKRQYDDFVIRGSYWVGSNRGYCKAKPGDDFYTQGFYFDLADHKIRRICVAEVNEVYAAVVVGGRAWFAGLTNGKAALVGVGNRDRVTVALPQADEIPDLGMDGESLLAVYSKKIFRLTDREWTLVHSGDILLPRSGLPPQLHGNMVFLRDEEERRGHGKRLWWLTLGEQLHLHALDHNVGVVGDSGPRWENSPCYCVTRSGDLWACVGDSNAASLLRRSKDGSYSIATMNNSVQFTEDLLGSGKTDQALSVSAVAALPDDTLLLAGHTGLYRLKGNELAQEVAFIPQETTDSRGNVVLRWPWDPSSVLVLNDKSYFIGGSFGGVYLLSKRKDGQWSFLSVDEKLGDPVVW